MLLVRLPGALVLVGTDNSHFRKYLTTLGVSLIAGSISLAGLFLKLQSDLVIESEKLNALTPEARQAVIRRQHYLDWAMAGLPYFLGIVVAVGLVIAFIGLRGWAKRQKVADSKEEMEGRKLEVEIRNLTAQERSEKIEKEVQEVISDASHTAVKFTLFPPSPEAVTYSVNRSPSRNHDDVRNRIEHITYQVATLAEAIYGAKQISRDVVVDGRRKFYPDLVVHPTENTPGWVFEIKYLNHPANLRNRVSEGFIEAIRGANLVGLARAMAYSPVFILVYEDALYEKIKERFEREVTDLAPNFVSIPAALGVGRLSLDNLSPSQLKAALEGE